MSLTYPVIKPDSDDDFIIEEEKEEVKKETVKVHEDFKDEEIAEIIKSTPDIEEPEINDDAQLFRDEYKYKDRIRRLLEQNNIENVMQDVKEVNGITQNTEEITIKR